VLQSESERPRGPLNVATALDQDRDPYSDSPMLTGTSVRPVRRTTHTRRVAPGGFRTVELNAVGWASALVPAALAGATLGFVATRSVAVAAAGAAAGAASGFGLARLWDARRDERTWINVPVRDAENAVWVLRSSGVAAAPSTVIVSDAEVHYVTVKANDQSRATMLVGLPTESTRARRRARDARSVVSSLPQRKPTI